MTDKRQLPGNDEAPTPEEKATDAAFEKKRLAAEQDIKDMEGAGWTWQGKDLVSPHDQDIFVGYDPFTADLFLSSKLAEQVAGRVRASGSELQGR